MEKVLIVVDMQNDFVDGSLGTKEAVKIVPTVADKIKAAINNNNMVMFYFIIFFYFLWQYSASKSIFFNNILCIFI